MSNGPVPSHICFLSDLSIKSSGDKVRFLGCVTSYAAASGVLTLRHEHPRASRDCALVDVRLLLETLTANQLQVGEWVNVIGYITKIVPSQLAHSSARDAKGTDVHVQALILWSAGPLDIQNYERCLESWVADVNT